MKIRNGFVSNSSSSSYICDVCGEIESGMDLSMSDIEMFDCENGHTVCDKHKIGGEEDELIYARKYMLSYNKDDSAGSERINQMGDDEFQEEYEDAIDEMRYEGYPAEACPICQFKEVDEKEMLYFLIKEKNIDKKDFLCYLKDNFANYKEFQKAIKDMDKKFHENKE